MAGTGNGGRLDRDFNPSDAQKHSRRNLTDGKTAYNIIIRDGLAKSVDVSRWPPVVSSDKRSGARVYSYSRSKYGAIRFTATKAIIERPPFEIGGGEGQYTGRNTIRTAA